jgi:hypothetical protein
LLKGCSFVSRPQFFDMRDCYIYQIIYTTRSWLPSFYVYRILGWPGIKGKTCVNLHCRDAKLTLFLLFTPNKNLHNFTCNRFHFYVWPQTKQDVNPSTPGQSKMSVKVKHYHGRRRNFNMPVKLSYPVNLSLHLAKIYITLHVTGSI